MIVTKTGVFVKIKKTINRIWFKILSTELGIEGVAEAVAEEVEAEHGEADEAGGEEEAPGVVA